jgi:hypothetical protein
MDGGSHSAANWWTSASAQDADVQSRLACVQARLACVQARLLDGYQEVEAMS